MRASRVISFSALFFAVYCAVGAVGVAPLAPDAANLPVKTIVQKLPLPSLEDQMAKIILQQQHFIKEEKCNAAIVWSLAATPQVLMMQSRVFIKSDSVARGGPSSCRKNRNAQNHR